MMVPVMAISNLVLTQQIYSEETNGAHAHYREPVPLTQAVCVTTHKGSWVKLLLRLISIVTRSSSHESNPGIKTLLPFLKNITEESDLENFQDLIVALDACY